MFSRPFVYAGVHPVFILMSSNRSGYMKFIIRNRRSTERSYSSPVRMALVCGVCLLGLVACDITHTPMSEADRMENVQKTYAHMFPAEQEVISHPLAMEDIMARALIYNLDSRVQLQERKLAEAALKVSKMELLPDLNFDARLSARSNVAASKSEEIATGVQNLNFSRSSEDTVQSYKIDLTYDLIELGMNYIRAQQEAKRVEIMKERRRSVLQNLMRDARVTYMRAAVAQMLEDDVRALKLQADEALVRAEKAYDQGLVEPVENLSYRKGLLEVVSDLDRLLSQFTTAKIELATLINIPPGTPIELELPPVTFAQTPTVNATVDQMEAYALLNRPELIEEDYQYEIEKQDRESFWINMLPNVQPSLAYNYDNNQFLLNNSWITLGVNVAYNLMDLLASQPREDEILKTLEFAAMKRDAMTMAVLGQVNLAYLRHKEALERLDISQQLYTTEEGITRNLENYLETGQSTSQDVILAQARTLLARVEYYADIIDAHTTLADLILAVGYDAIPFEPSNHDIETLAVYIDRHSDRLLSPIRNKSNLQRILDVDTENKRITLTAVHYTKLDRPWLVKTGPFNTQSGALKAAKGINKVFEIEMAKIGADKYVAPVPYLRLEGEYLADYQYYLAFDNLQMLGKDRFCQILLSSGHVCERNNFNYAAQIDYDPDIWAGNN